jgi:HAMP domain-containing protein
VAIYLALFATSALTLGAFVYFSIRHEVLADFHERINEESDALRAAFADGGRGRLAAIIEARGSGGGFDYGLIAPDGARLAGDLTAPKATALSKKGEWVEEPERESDEPKEATEIVGALASRLPDGSVLIVGDERRRVDAMLRRVVSAFGWAVAATLVVGTLGGLWLSAQFLKRVDAMRLTAQSMMAGDFSRPIPARPTDDDLSALARTFNRLFDRIEKLLMATGGSAPTSRTICASRWRGFCAASRGSRPRTPRSMRRAPPLRRPSRRSKRCSRCSRPCCASARSKRARARGLFVPSISPPSPARSSRPSSRPPRKREG